MEDDKLWDAIARLTRIARKMGVMTGPHMSGNDTLNESSDSEAASISNSDQDNDASSSGDEE
jgi:hypothetical protein